MENAMRILSTTALLLTLQAAPALAQDSGDVQGVGVARLSLVNGDVTLQRGDSGELIAGERNAPLVERDHVITGPNSRAEVQFDWANSIRLDSLAEVRIAELDPGDSFIQIVAGTAMFSVLEDSSTLFEISTPIVSVRPLRKGLYRIEVRPDGSTDVIVRSGEAEIFTANETRRLGSGTALAVFGDPADPDLAVLGTRPFDEWDRWNEARDRDLARDDSYQYVSRDIYGAEDLGRYGRWVSDATYGWVWAPEVAPGWAPYRVGRWSWVDYYGWTWISADPWGWAPYHYGRWYHAPRYGWVWYPGARQERHYWRPALVSFFGWNSARVRVGVSVGFGNIGWVPLAPREIYRPWYGHPGPRNVTINNVVVVNNINIVETNRNARFIDGRTAVTSLSSTTFGRTRVTTENIVRVTDRDLRRVAQVRAQLPVEPSSESRRYSDRTARARSVPQAEAMIAMSARRGEGGEPASTAVGSRMPVNAAAPTQSRARVSVSNAAETREPATSTSSLRATGSGEVRAQADPGRRNAVRVGTGEAVAADPGVGPRRSTGTTAPTRGAAPASTRRRSRTTAVREAPLPGLEASRAPTRSAPSAVAGPSGGSNPASRRITVPIGRSDNSSGGSTTKPPTASTAPTGRSTPVAEGSPPRADGRTTAGAASPLPRSQNPARRDAASPSPEVSRAPARRAPDPGPSGGRSTANQRITVPNNGADRGTGGNTPPPAVRNAPDPNRPQGRSGARPPSREPARVERPQSRAPRPAPSPGRQVDRAPTQRNAPAREARPSPQSNSPSRGAVPRGNPNSRTGGNAGNPGNRGAARPR